RRRTCSPTTTSTHDSAGSRRSIHLPPGPRAASRAAQTSCLPRARPNVNASPTGSPTSSRDPRPPSGACARWRTTAPGAPTSVTGASPDFLLRSPRKSTRVPGPGPGLGVALSQALRGQATPLPRVGREQVAVELGEAAEVMDILVQVGDLDHRLGAELRRQMLDVSPVALGEGAIVAVVESDTLGQVLVAERGRQLGREVLAGLRQLALEVHPVDDHPAEGQLRLHQLVMEVDGFLDGLALGPADDEEAGSRVREQLVYALRALAAESCW